jgi:hypothetical protein
MPARPAFPDSLIAFGLLLGLKMAEISGFEAFSFPQKGIFATRPAFLES